MRTEGNYWVKRMNNGRLTRRRFVGGTAALGTGAAALGLVGCGGDDDDDDAASPTSAATAAGGSPTAAASPTPTPVLPQKGGVARGSSANNTWDTFDADRSRFSPFAAILGYTNLGIVHYSDWQTAELEGGFAEKWETPDNQTLVFKLRPNLTWHNKPPVSGRAAKVEDMKFFIDRNKAGQVGGKDDPNFYRKGDYLTVESVDVTDATTLRVKFSRPNPFFMSTLAGSYSKVQAPEAVALFEADYAKWDAKQIIGTGAFVLDEFKAEGDYKLSRFAKFAMGSANFDGLQGLSLFTDAAAQQAAFEQKQMDVFGPRSVTLLDELLKRYDGKMYNQPNFAANPVAGTYYGGAPPWNNKNLIGAIFRTVDRRQLIQQLLQGSGALAANIVPSQAAFGLTERELIQYPGYLEDRAKDLSEAKKMWDAGGGPALGPVIVDIANIYEGAYAGVGASMAKTFKDALGGDWEIKIEPYATITAKIVRLQYGDGSNNIWYGWISDVLKLEPTLDLWGFYNSKAPQFAAYGVNIPKVDELTDKAVLELDVNKRKEYDREILKLLLENWGAGIPHSYLSITNALRWNYAKTGQPSGGFVNSHNTWRDSWFDQKDPTWQGRPA